MIDPLKKSSDTQFLKRALAWIGRDLFQFTSGCRSGFDDLGKENFWLL